MGEKNPQTYRTLIQHFSEYFGKRKWEFLWRGNILELAPGIFLGVPDWGWAGLGLGLRLGLGLGLELGLGQGWS